MNHNTFLCLLEMINFIDAKEPMAFERDGVGQQQVVVSHNHHSCAKVNVIQVKVGAEFPRVDCCQHVLSIDFALGYRCEHMKQKMN
jgi:hypothetical protein